MSRDSYASIAQRLNQALTARHVPANEILALGEAVHAFVRKRVPGPQKNCRPDVGVLVSKPELGRVHVTFLVTWPELALESPTHDRVMGSLSDAFTRTVSSLRQPHLRAHLEFVPGSALTDLTFEEYLSERARRDRSESQGAWRPDKLVIAA